MIAAAPHQTALAARFSRAVIGSSPALIVTRPNIADARADARPGQSAKGELVLNLCPRQSSRIATTPLIVLAAALTLVSDAVGQGPPPTAVRVDSVRSELVREQRQVTGQLKAVQHSKVAAQEPGIIIDLPARQGQSVIKGQPLARLDSLRLELELRQAEAEVKAAEALLHERQAEQEWRGRDLERYRLLQQGGATNPKEMTDAEMADRIAAARLASAQSGVDLLRARADLIRKRIADTTIAAPFDGVVVARIAEQGQWLAEGDALVEVVATNPIEAWLDVPQQYAGAVLQQSSRPECRITIDATGAAHETLQARPIPLIDPQARTFSMVATLDNQAALLAPGMSVTAWVPTGEQAERLTVSRSAIMRSEVGAYVYAVRSMAPGAAPSVVPVHVQVLFNHDDRLVVRSPDLAAGEQVVVEGNERLFPMMPVQPVPVEQDQHRGAETDAKLNSRSDAAADQVGNLSSRFLPCLVSVFSAVNPQSRSGR
jgi:RND family efflux transporter MFP subunit